jgi:hypothetical protein
MAINRVLTLAGITALLVVGWTYVPPRSHQRKQQPRIYVGDLVGNDYSEWIKDFRMACPHMAFVQDEKAADYTIKALWVPSQPPAWHAMAERRDKAFLCEGESPDYVQLLRDSCRLIRADLEDWAEFEREKPPTIAPTGRYVLTYHSTNYNQALLLDTKTGAVWELGQVNDTVAQLGYRSFSRISVDGLYTSLDEQTARVRDIERSQDTEAKKKADRDMSEKMWEEERKREDDLNDQ